MEIIDFSITINRPALGNGVLHSPDLAPGKPLYVGDLTPGQATIFKTALQNSGVRAVYVRLQVRLLLHLVL